MKSIIDAVYDNGVFRPVAPVLMPNGVHVQVVFEPDQQPCVDGGSRALYATFGTMPDQDAEEIMRIVDEEFERVDLDEWR